MPELSRCTTMTGGMTHVEDGRTATRLPGRRRSVCRAPGGPQRSRTGSRVPSSEHPSAARLPRSSALERAPGPVQCIGFAEAHQALDGKQREQHATEDEVSGRKSVAPVMPRPGDQWCPMSELASCKPVPGDEQAEDGDERPAKWCRTFAIDATPWRHVAQQIKSEVEVFSNADGRAQEDEPTHQLDGHRLGEGQRES